MTAAKARILLAAIISVRASAYLFSKLLLESMGPFTLMGIRFLLAFALLSLVFRRRFLHMNRQAFLGGLTTGLAFFATMAFELCALQRADSSVVAFLENTAIVLVPLMTALLMAKPPDGRTLAVAVVALSGVGLLTLGTGGIGPGLGEALGLGAAVCYAIAMIVTDRVSKEGDVLLMGVLQVGWIGLFGMVGAFAFESPCPPATASEWTLILVLAVVCTGFGFALQPVAQRPLAASDVSIMCAISPVVAALLGVMVLSEQLSISSVLGMALILASVFLSCVKSGGRPSDPAQITFKERRQRSQPPAS